MDKDLPSILIAEDEPSLLKVLGKKLAELGCNVLTASDGEEALKIIKTKDLRLVILDVIMPLRNGFDVLQEMRTKLNNKTPVIMVSNLEGANDIETARNLGIDDYIVKSNISLRDLSQSVASYIRPAS